MTTNITNQAAYLRTTRQFPTEINQLTLECNKAYLDTANAINVRTIGIFSTNVASIGGESWYLQGNRKQQSFREVYQFTSVANIPHMLNLQSVDFFTKPSGSYTDGTNYYGAIYGSNVPIAGQISFYITSTDIVLLSGAGAPTPTNGLIILEWISNP